MDPTPWAPWTSMDLLDPVYKVPVPSLALFLRHLRIIVRAARRKHQETSPHLAPSDWTPTNMDGSWWWNVFELFWHVLRLDGLQGLHIIISIIKWWSDKLDGSGYSRYPTCPILIPSWSILQVVFAPLLSTNLDLHLGGAWWPALSYPLLDTGDANAVATLGWTWWNSKVF